MIQRLEEELRDLLAYKLDAEGRGVSFSPEDEIVRRIAILSSFLSKYREWQRARWREEDKQRVDYDKNRVTRSGAATVLIPKK